MGTVFYPFTQFTVSPKVGEIRITLSGLLWPIQSETLSMRLKPNAKHRQVGLCPLSSKESTEREEC